MTWPGYFFYGGTEVINATRTEAYARAYQKGWFKPVYKENDLSWLLGEDDYSSPLQDDAPWTDPDNTLSYDFYGAYPLNVTGIEDSTVDASVTESVVDGGYVGRTRRKTRSVVFEAALIGASECAVEYGLRWLRSVLNGGPCFGQMFGSCGGAELCFLACPPSVTDDPPVTLSPGPVVVESVNLATNPNAEVGGVSGWLSNDPASWLVSAPSTNPISGTNSVMATRQANVLDATNLVPNPRLVGSPLATMSPTLARWVPSRSTIAADATLRRHPTGPQSAKVICNASGGTYVMTANTTAVNRIPLSPAGGPFTSMASVYPDPATLGSVHGGKPRFNLQTYQYDASNVLISAIDGTFIDCPVGQWTDLRYTFTPAANCATIRFIVQSYSLDVTTPGQTFWFCEPLMVMGTYTGAYFDGSTPNTGVNDYRWTGAADVSTSERRAVPASDPAVASLYFLADPNTRFACTPGVPITLAVDVRVEQPNRQIDGSFAWFNGPVSAVTVTPAGPAGSVTRFVMTGTPPAGVTSVYPVVEVKTTGGGPALNGERTWWDNLYVGNDSTGVYFDGSTPDDGDLSYAWTGADSASTSLRSVQTYVGSSEPAEDCYARVGRSLHDVTTTVGPVLTKKLSMIDGGAVWTVTWTMVAADPTEFGVTQPLVLGFGDPKVNVPYVGGEVPEGGDYDLHGHVQTDPSCPAPVFRPVFDPECSLLQPPPDLPTVVPMCFSFPVNYLRRSFTVPRTSIPLWTEVAPIVTLHTGTSEARAVRLRFYADVFDTGTPDRDPCNFCGDVVFSYIPAGSTILLDCADRQVYIDQPGAARRRADSLVSDSYGAPIEWPVFSCGFGYVVTIDQAQKQVSPIVDLSLVPRVL